LLKARAALPVGLSSASVRARLPVERRARPRRYAAFAYDPDLTGCVLHGGAADDTGRKIFGDAWLTPTSAAIIPTGSCNPCIITTCYPSPFLAHLKNNPE
jgi:hypothetical protein